MPCFLVAVKDAVDDDRSALLRKLNKDRFPETIEYIKQRVWLVVATRPTTTTGDLVEALAPEEDEESLPLFFATKLHQGQYNGIADIGLWEKLEAWEDAGHV